MRERAALIGATLEIESAEGQGTTILLRMSSEIPETPHA
jgi:signal transduction histidine kinase